MKKERNYIVLISVDAVAGTDLDKLCKLPVFKYFKENGVSCSNVKTVYPTITYPIHTSVITGRSPEGHKIFHNQPWQADVPTVMRKWFWGVEDIGTRTLWDAAADEKYKTLSVLWPVSGKAGRRIRWDFPEVMPLPGEVPFIKMMTYASKLWLAYTEIKYGKQRVGMRRQYLDDYMALLCEKVIAGKRMPDLMTIHFADTDVARHDHGVGSPEDEAALVRMNDRVGRIVEAVKKRGVFDKTVFVIMSDHGQENVVNGYIPLDEKLCDAGIGRAHSTGRGAFIYADDFESAAKYLKEHSEELHIKEVLEDKKLREIHAPIDIKLAVQAEEGYGYVDRNGECDHKGDHGFGLESPEARTFLLMCGEPFKKGVKLDEAEIVDIAPTIAHIGGLSMPGCDGKVLKEALKTFD